MLIHTMNLERIIMKERKLLNFKEMMQINILGLSASENEMIKNYMLEILDSTSIMEAAKAYLELKDICGSKILKQVMNYKIKIELTTIKFKELPQVVKTLQYISHSNIFTYPIIVGVNENGTDLNQQFIRTTYMNDLFIRGTYYELYPSATDLTMQEYRDKKYQFSVINRAILRGDTTLLQQWIDFLEHYDCYHWVIDYFSLTPSAKAELVRKNNC